MDPARLPLSRGVVGRAALRRTEPDLLATTWHDPRTRVLVVADGRVPTRSRDGVVGLDLHPPLGEAPGGPVVFLGEDDDGTYLALILPDEPTGAVDIEGVARVSGWETALAGCEWAVLRDVGDLLDDRDAGLAVTAVALAAWHQNHPRCARCGARTEPDQGGWTRTCPIDGSDHYPRTDPAVIMAIIDDADRLLLGHAAQWPANRFSTLAGFVEPGESAEAAVRREVLEESGVVVGEVTYQGSQPWPFPGSLMLAFTGRATGTDLTPDGVEVTDLRWFSRAELAAAVAAREVLLPMRSSIARVLVEDWFGGPLPDAPAKPVP